MNSKELLLKIPELNLIGKPAMTSDGQFQIYVKGLNTFVDNSLSMGEKMQDAVDEQSYSTLSRLISDMFRVLVGIYADNMSKEWRKKFDEINKVGQPQDWDALEAYVEGLILEVSSLSVDVQMALKRGGSSSSPATGAASTVSTNTSAPIQTAVPAPDIPKRIFGGGRPLILAVDNAVMFLNTLTKLLEGSSYDVHCVTSGDEALQFIKTNNPEAFLLDVEMPGMDGYELARRIKASGQRAPIIFVTANSARSYVDKAAEAGAVGMLMKPLRAHQLISKLKQHV
jgi:CheY-like chemotaxis protein